jgi:hypothetical protein
VLGPFQNFSKLTEIVVSQGAPRVSTTPVTNFATNTAGVLDTSGEFGTGVNNTGKKFAACVNDTGGK